MSELRFELSRASAEPATGFDLGDLSVSGDQGSTTSAGRTPNQSMMIYVALVGLLDGIAQLLRQGSGRYRFVGTDSSFRLDFTLSKSGVMTIAEGQGTPLAATPLAVAVRSVRDGVERFLTQAPHRLSPTDPVAEDLQAARRGFETAARSAGV